MKYGYTAEANQYPCVYGNIDAETYQSIPCGRSAVYRAIMGGERTCYCDYHAAEVEASDVEVLE